MHPYFQIYFEILMYFENIKKEKKKIRNNYIIFHSIHFDQNGNTYNKLILITV